MRKRFLSVAMLVFALAASPLKAQDENGTEVEATPSASAGLGVQQTQLAVKYERLEKLLIRMSEVEVSTNPRRAECIGAQPCPTSSLV